MKILILNKTEQKELEKLLVKIIKDNTNSHPYEVTTILEKLNPQKYEYLFSIMKDWINYKVISLNFTSNFIYAVTSKRPK